MVAHPSENEFVENVQISLLHASYDGTFVGILFRKTATNYEYSLHNRSQERPMMIRMCN